MNVITLLTNDHRTVEGLFERYRSATVEAKQLLLDEITRELMKHMDAEENVLYPQLRTSIHDGVKLMAEAVDEHEKAKGLLAELQNAEAGSFEMDSRISTLQKAIAHHVREEEGNIFPEMQKSLDAARLEQLGGQIEEAKRSAPETPPPSAEEDSPGVSLGGVVTAAGDRLKDAVRGKE